MAEVILTVGARAAGKSTFCEKFLLANPKTVLVSRDQILLKLFDSVYVGSYSGGHHVALEIMWDSVESHLLSGCERLILDAWNGDSSERRFIIRKLRKLGASRVVAWYFVTPVEQVVAWFWQKPGVARIKEMKTRSSEKGLVFFSDITPRYDNEQFHHYALDIDRDGFDKVIRINPVESRAEELVRA